MRLLLRPRAIFSTDSSVSMLIKEAQNRIVRDEKSRLIYFQKTFSRLFGHVSRREKAEAQIVKRVQNLCLMQAKPAHAIATYFHMTSKQFSEEVTTQTWVSLAKATYISRVDNHGTLDTAGFELYFTAEFENICQEVKFGLKERRIGFDNIIKIGRACIDMGYLDYQLFSLMKEQLGQEILSDRTYTCNGQHTSREFQIEKKGYYDQDIKIFEREILNSHEFQTSLETIRSRNVKEIEFPTDAKEIVTLVDELKQANRNINKVVEGILAARSAYKKLANFSQSDAVKRRPALNLQVLEMEEKLLTSKIINIEDIKNLSQLDDPNYEAERCEEILSHMLNLPSLAMFRHISEEVPDDIIRPQKDPLQRYYRINQAMTLLADFAMLDRKVYFAQDSRSLINLKWQKSLLGDKEADQREDLGVACIFRRVYCEVHELFLEWLQRGKLKSLSSLQIQHRLQHLTALLKVGFFKEVIVSLEYIPIVQIDDMTKEQFSQLVSLLNDIGKRINLNILTKQKIITRLSQEIMNETVYSIGLPLRHLLDATNMLAQNYQLQTDIFAREVYGELLQQLERWGRQYTGFVNRDPLATELFKVLALQMPDKYLKAPVYEKYLKDRHHESYKMNPFSNVIADIVRKKIFKDEAEVDFRIPFIRVGFDGKTMKGVMIAESEDTSIDGTQRRGDYNAFVKRIEEQYNLSLKDVAVNRFFTLDYQRVNPFVFKSDEQIMAQLMSVVARDGISINSVLREVRTLLLHLKQQYITPIVDKIEMQILILEDSMKVETGTSSKQQYVSTVCKQLLELISMKKDLGLLRSELEGLKSLKLSSYYSQLKNSQKNLDNIIKTRKRMLESHGEPLTNKIQLGGKRLTIETYQADDPVWESKDVAMQLIDSFYYSSNNYVQYQDWQILIESQYNIDQIAYENLSPLGKILVSKFCPRATQQISKLPFLKKDNQVKLIHFDTQSLGDTQTTLSKAKKVKISAQMQQMIRQITVLQNFKHFLKMKMNETEIVEYILNFSFIRQLPNMPPNQNFVTLPRDPEHYFSYLEQRYKGWERQSPNVSYLLSKLKRTDRAQELLEKRRIMRMNHRILFKQGRISRQQYYGEIEQVEQEIIQEMEKLKDKMMDSMDDTLLDGGLKMIDIKVEDINLLRDWFARSRSYQRSFDEDYISVKGDLEAAMQLKRGRAQVNLQKYYLIYSLAKNQTLNEIDQIALLEWRNEIQLSIHGYVAHTEYTHQVIADLSLEDQQRLSISGHNMVGEKIPVIDLITELVTFFDESVLAKAESQIAAKFYHSNYNIPEQLFLSSRSNQFTQLCFQKEQALINQHARLNPKELDTLFSMVKVFKTENFFQNHRFKTVYEDFEKVISQMNNYYCRNELISQYVAALEKEFFTDYNASLIDGIKQREVRHFWQQVFGCEMETANEQDITTGVGKLCLRLKVLNNTSPIFFAQFIISILNHKHTSCLAKEHLIASLELEKTKLILDTADIKAVALGTSEWRPSFSKINQQLQQCCNKNFSLLINSRLLINRIMTSENLNE